MRGALLFLALAACCPAQYRLYTCMATSKGYVVGAKLPPSGVFFRTPGGRWTHAGFNHPYLAAADYNHKDPSTLYLAAGNGLIRAANDGRDWRILTSHDVTELRDVSVGPDGAIYFAHTAGLRVSRDGGATWHELSGAWRRKYAESVRADWSRAGRVVAGGEDGLLLSEDGGMTWRRAGAAGFQVMHIEQSPREACHWLAVTQQGGLFVSRDCGASFENSGHAGVDRNLYDIAFDPTTAGRIALAGWGPGVMVSDDDGKTWQERNQGLPSANIWSVAFDPAHAGRMYASVHEEAVYASDDAGRTWKRDGLEGSVVYRMKFVPEGSAR